jgi:hypothetical protein
MALVNPESLLRGDAHLSECSSSSSTADSVHRAIEKFIARTTRAATDTGRPVMGADAVLDGGLGWSLVQRDPYRDGLNARGCVAIDMEISTRSAVTLIGRVFACVPALDEQGETFSEISKVIWVDVLLRQIPGSANDNPNMRGLSVIELSAYEKPQLPSALGGVDRPSTMVGEDIEVVHTQRSFTMPLAFSTALTLQVQFQDGSLLLRMRHSQTMESLVEMRLKQFGRCVPMIKMRSGRQPFTSGVMHASFSQRAEPSLR